MIKLKKFTAFTLAETLIVMGVIGVVAALTIPSLTNSTNSKDVVAKVRKSHSILEDAFGRMVAKHGELEEWSANITSATLGNRLASSMKLTKECKSDASCLTTSTNALKEDGSASTSPGYSAILADGTAIGINVFDNTCANNIGTTAPLKKVCGSVVVDIDGYNGKKTHGIDQFDFWLTTTGLIPVGSESDSKKPFTTAENCKSTGGVGCTAWIIYNGNLDYRNANDSHVCNTNSGITLGWAAGNTACD